MDFHQLKIFAAVYRLRSFTGASKELGISQPTISEHIKNLETEFSCRLFDRLGRSIMPTSQAELLFPRAQQLLDSLSTLHDDLAGSAEQVSGVIAFGTSTIPGTYIIPTMAVEFKDTFPEVTFEIIIKDTATILEMILAHEIFCGIVGARHDSEKLQFVPFVRDELVLVASDKLGLPPEISPEQLTDLPFLLREEGSGTRKCMTDYFTEGGINPQSLQTVATLGSTAAVKEAARQGLGTTVLSKLAVENELADGTLHQIKITGLAMTRDFYLVHHKQRTMPNRYQTLLRHLQNRPSR
ncbi:MAG: selenium metabolism-associated LysR family transcriptional regulator [Thermodesulfobacteriota bacterium]